VANAPTPGSVENVQASGTPNTAACVTATSVPTDAAFTSQVPSAGESSVTGVPPDNGRARLQTCPEAPLDGTLVVHSENPVVARWLLLGSVVLGLAWWAMSDREEWTCRFDGANLHGENVPLSDEWSSAASGEGFTDDCISRPDVVTAIMEERPLARSEICVASEDSALDGANLHGEKVALSDECSSTASGKGSTDDCMSRSDVVTATMEELPLARSEVYVAGEDSAQVEHKASLLNRCAVALVISGAVIGIWLIWMSRSPITREIPQHAENSCDADGPFLCSRVVDEVADHTVMAASCNTTPAISMSRGVDSVAGFQAQGGERHAVVVPLVDRWQSERPEAQGAVAHAVSLSCDQEAVDDTGPALARVVFENCPTMPQQWDMSASVRGISGRVRSRVSCFEK